MHARRLILTVFFTVLVISALFGSYGLAANDEEIFFRGLGSTIAVTLGCLVLYPASWLALLKYGKHVSRFAMSWVSLEVTLCVLFSIVVDRRFMGWRGMDEFLVGMIPVIFFCGLILMIPIYLRSFKSLRFSMDSLIISTVIFVGLVLLANYEWSNNQYRFGGLYEDLAILMCCFGIGLTFLLIGSWRWYKLAGLIIGSMSALLFVLSILEVRKIDGTNMWQVAGLSSMAVCFAYGNLVWSLPLKDSWTRLIRLIAMGLVIGGSVVMVYLCWNPHYLHGRPDMSFLRIIGMLAFIAISMTFVISFVAAVAAIKIRRTDSPPQFNYTQLQIQCPHCQTAQLLTEAGQCCCECGLQFHFRITEPHCDACDYLLIGQAKGTCPECGHTISHARGQRLAT